MSFDRFKARVVYVPTLLWNILLNRILRLRRWWDPVDDVVILGAVPFRSDVQALYEQGVRGVVNTCEEFDGHQEAYRTMGIEQFHMPTTDFTHPSLDDVTRAVEFIERFAKRGEKVYVHCKAGRARSATVVMCWLMKNRQMTPAQAQQHLLSVRPHINPRLEQRPVVLEYARQLSDDKQHPVAAD